MHARVPQDVDLEDRLIYGLTPVRFGYLVVTVLASLSTWRADLLPAWLRVTACLILLASGGALAWGRWSGRALDRWLLDLAVFSRRNYHVVIRRAPARCEVLVPLRAIGAITEPGGSAR